jgi:hypothetical protein
MMSKTKIWFFQLPSGVKCFSNLVTANEEADRLLKFSPDVCVSEIEVIEADIEIDSNPGCSGVSVLIEALMNYDANPCGFEMDNLRVVKTHRTKNYGEYVGDLFRRVGTLEQRLMKLEEKVNKIDCEVCDLAKES